MPLFRHNLFRIGIVQSFVTALILVFTPIHTTFAASSCAGFIPSSITTSANLITAIQQANSANCPGADTIDLNGNTITFTSATFSGGGESVALPSVTTPITIMNGTITRSSASSFKFLYAFNTSLTLANVTMSNGGGSTISLGGALHTESTTLTITNSTFTNNNAGSYAGGALFVATGSLTVTGSTFNGNQASNGGAISTQNVQSATISFSRFYGNQAANDGGGILFGSGSNVSLLVESSLFVGNRALHGGAIYMMDNHFTLRNSTIAGNAGEHGLFIRGSSPLTSGTITNSVIWGNSSTDLATSEGPPVTVSYSAINGWDGGGTGNITSGYTADQIFANPLLAPSTSNTGTSYNHAPYDWRLLIGSPAINAGNNSGAPATDLAGTTRIQGGTIDMGAYEGGFAGPQADVTISPASFPVNEGSNANFTITRSGASGSPLTVTLNITQGAGTTTADYTLSGGTISAQSGNGVTVTIPVGSSSVLVNLAGKTDYVVDGNKTLTLTLVDGAAYNLGAMTSSTATIVDTTVLTTLTVDLTLQGRPAAPNAAYMVSGEIEIRPTSGGAAILSTTFTANNTGRFTVANVPTGTFDIWVKGSHTLARLHEDVAVSVIGSPFVTAQLLEGDANDDNSVLLADFSILASAFSTEAGDPAYDARADFNMDGMITLTDFSLLASNFSVAGD